MISVGQPVRTQLKILILGYTICGKPIWYNDAPMKSAATNLKWEMDLFWVPRIVVSGMWNPHFFFKGHDLFGFTAYSLQNDNMK